MGRREDQEYEMSQNGKRSRGSSRRHRGSYSDQSEQGYRPSKLSVQLFSPIKNHTCTDIICTILFLVFLIVLILLSLFAYVNGKPGDLILPHDNKGNICGKTETFEEKKFLFFFDLTQCLSFRTAIGGCPTRQICVSKCPSINAYKEIPSHKVLIDDFCDGTECPTYLLKSQPVFGRCIPELIAAAVNSTQQIVEAFDTQNNESVQIQTPFVNGGKLTINSIKDAIYYIQNVLNLKQFFESAYEDLTKTYLIIIIALAAGAVISLIWIVALRFIVKPMIYSAIIVVLGLLAYGTFFCISEYLTIKNNASSSSSSGDDLKFQFEKIYDLNYMTSLKETWLAFGIISGIVFIILFLIIVFLRKRINLAVELIKEASKAIIAIPSSLIFPIFPFLLELGVIVYCASTALFLASAGIKLFKITDTSVNATQNSTLSFNYEARQYKVGDFCIPDDFYTFKNSTNDPNLRYIECYFYLFGFDTQLPFSIDSDFVNKYYTKGIDLINGYQWIPQVYVLFMFFWLSAFVVGLNEMTISGSFSTWYWSQLKNVNRELLNKTPFFTLLGSLGRAFFYHFGTIAFGSLLIAIVKLIRVILEFISERLKSNTDSKIVEYIMCCMKCCFWCLEKFIKFLNRYAFIVTAAYSYNFCRAAAKAFKLITTNVVRVVVVDKITNFIILLSNIAITAAVGLLGFAFFTKRIPIDIIIRYTPDLNYYFVPLILIILGVFAITRLFFDVFSMGVDTLLICVLIDVDEHDGTTERPYFMSKDLKKILNVSNRGLQKY